MTLPKTSELMEEFDKFKAEGGLAGVPDGERATIEKGLEARKRISNFLIAMQAETQVETAVVYGAIMWICVQLSRALGASKEKLLEQAALGWDIQEFSDLLARNRPGEGP